MSNSKTFYSLIPTLMSIFSSLNPSSGLQQAFIILCIQLGRLRSLINNSVAANNLPFNLNFFFGSLAENKL